MTIQAPDPLTSVEGIMKAAAILLCIAAIVWLVWDNHSLTAEVTQQKDEIAQYKAANKEFSDLTKKQNASIKGLNDAAAARKIVADKAVAAAQKQASVYYTRAAQIMATPIKLTDECAETKQIIDNYFGVQ